MYDLSTFQGLVAALQHFWQQKGCIILQPIDLEVGAGTFHPSTFLRAIGPEPWKAAHVQSSRRPCDGRYGEHPNRGQHFYQYQVVLKPVPNNFQELYLESLKFIGIDPLQHDIRFVEDNWAGPTLGAWGIGWEVWLDGMEITQFTYFQQVGGLDCKPIMGELAYGIERIAMYLQKVNSTQDLIWAKTDTSIISYADIYKQNEYEMSCYNFKNANTKMLFQHFNDWEKEANNLIENKLPIPAYEAVIKSSHIFNILDSRSAISVTERQNFILRIRNLSCEIAQLVYQKREELGFPLCNS